MVAICSKAACTKAHLRWAEEPGDLVRYFHLYSRDRKKSSFVVQASVWFRTWHNDESSIRILQNTSRSHVTTRHAFEIGETSTYKPWLIVVRSSIYHLCARSITSATSVPTNMSAHGVIEHLESLAS